MMKGGHASPPFSPCAMSTDDVVSFLELSFFWGGGDAEAAGQRPGVDSVLKKNDSAEMLN
jgi:hypothetical protein